MSRSGHNDDCSDWALIRWRGAVNSAIKGNRGQEFLRELTAALDAMPEKRLIRGELESPNGEFCAIGVLGHARGVDMTKIDSGERVEVAAAFNIAPALAAEIVFENDEFEWCETPEQRWLRMRNWVAGNLIESQETSA